jgi:hypothetical protein
MSDPRDFDRRWDMDRRVEMDRRMGSPTPWGWIAGAVFIIVILALVFTSNESTRTARTDADQPSTTGMAPRTAPPAVPVQPRPGDPASPRQ